MRHIPNILSSCRIVLIPFFIWQMLAGNTMNAAIILLVSGVTDFLDGQLARRCGWVSDLGKMLDPAADKLTQVAVSVMMAIKLRRYWPIFVVLIAKEFVMLILGGYLLKKGVKLEGAKWFGKVVTFMFYTVMVLIMFIPNMPSWLCTTLLAVTLGCAIFASLMYIPEYMQYRAVAKNKEKAE